LTSEVAPDARPVSQGMSDFEFEPHNCFACGALNDHGLQLRLHLGDRRSWTDLTLDPRFEGWSGIAHGGIVATLLDEVMAWSLVAEDNWGVTARMSIDYKRPVPIDQPIRAEGWVVRTRRRLIDAAGQVTDGEGTVLATAQAVYLAADPVRKRELQERYGYRIRTVRAEDAGTPEPVDPR